MTTAPLIARPTFPIAGTHKYRLSPRLKSSFNTVLKATDIIDPNDQRTTMMRVEAGATGDITLHFDHPLIKGSMTDKLVLNAAPTGLRSSHLMRTIQALDGTQVRSEEVHFHGGVLPLPGACYPEVMLPFLLCWQPFDKTRRTLHAWINDRFVATTQYQGIGMTTVKLPGGTRPAWELVMWPDLNDWVNLGRMLTKLTYPLVPKYRMWFDPKEPHTVLRFEGPFGPPGAPEVVFEWLESDLD